MVRIIKEEEKFIGKRLVPKGISSKQKCHFQKLLYCDMFEFINAKNGEFFEYEYFENKLPDDDSRCIDYTELLLVVKKYKLDQMGLPFEEYKV
jgi:hypothetical protein